jgi:diketogulonate reductase-like aldo/keto reductase
MEGKFPEAWKALEKIYAEKRARAIGISNFKPHHLDTLLQTSEVMPAVNQIELHPLFQQKETRQHCAQHGIIIESYSPLMRGGEALENPVITSIAEQHGKTPAQVILRWHIQSGFIVIPKSVNPKRIQENFAVFDFELSQNDIQQIEGLDADRRITTDPDVAAFK